MAETMGGGYCVQFYDAGAERTCCIYHAAEQRLPIFYRAGFTLRGNTFNYVHNNEFARLTGEAISVFGGTSGTSNGEEILNNRFSDIGNSAIIIGVRLITHRASSSVIIYSQVLAKEGDL